ncbi:hypothetical protein UFOVP667_6 [uncultured Caudovirales phage]|uniref:Uncharacterized protein n=1 Tax=uncultured Caudovirales phage TaxID=2100421 RepID=A0A6J5N788_9CAUD|nr:hypothetical protein UFOVP667_6 [uncultured Caudovirales phage]
MKEIGNFFARLSSRKFLLTVGGIVAVTLYPEGATAICTLIATFVAGEGAADTVSRYAVEKTKREQAKAEAYKTEFLDTDDENVDTSQIVAGDAPL